MSFPSSSRHAGLYEAISADKSQWNHIHKDLHAAGWTPSIARRLVKLVYPDWHRGTYDQNMRLLLIKHLARPGHNFDFCGLTDFLPKWGYVWTRYGQSEICTRGAYTPWHYVTETLGYTEEQAIAHFSAQRRSPRLLLSQ